MRRLCLLHLGPDVVVDADEIAKVVIDTGTAHLHGFACRGTRYPAGIQFMTARCPVKTQADLFLKMWNFGKFIQKNVKKQKSSFRKMLTPIIFLGKIG